MAFVLPSRGDLLGDDAPWGTLLTCGSTGVWLVRSEVDGRVVYGGACADGDAVVSELAAALELECERWEELEECVESVEPALVYVVDAHRVLDDEPERLSNLLAALSRSPLRVVFQTRELDPDRYGVYTEFGVRVWTGTS